MVIVPIWIKIFGRIFFPNFFGPQDFKIGCFGLSELLLNNETKYIWVTGDFDLDS